LADFVINCTQHFQYLFLKNGYDFPLFIVSYYDRALHTVCFYSDGIPQKVFPTFDKVFIYLPVKGIAKISKKNI
jgi:hypothetical protein